MTIERFPITKTFRLSERALDSLETLTRTLRTTEHEALEVALLATHRASQKACRNLTNDIGSSTSVDTLTSILDDVERRLGGQLDRMEKVLENINSEMGFIHEGAP